MFTTGLVIGGIIGAAVGVLITSLCVVSKEELPFDGGGEYENNHSWQTSNEEK